MLVHVWFLHALYYLRQWLLKELYLRSTEELLRKPLRVLVYHFKFVNKFLLVVNFNRPSTHLVGLHHALRLIIQVYKTHVGLNMLLIDKGRVSIL
jgi:hypothetical protein